MEETEKHILEGKNGKDARKHKLPTSSSLNRTIEDF